MTSVGVLLTVAYDGTDFHGWAPQLNATTIAEELLRAIRVMRPDVMAIRGASRTDTGVHARGQRVAFDTVPGIPARGWVKGLAAHLPDAIVVRRASEVVAGFTPRFEGRGKRYIYTFLVDATRDPSVDRYALWVDGVLDLPAMHEEARLVVGTHDFAGFRSSADVRKDTMRTITRCELVDGVDDPRLIRLIVEGNGFMHNMVRILAGTLLDVGTGRIAPGAFSRALESRSRTDLGKTAPPHGLMLDEVFLSTEGAEGWPPMTPL